MSQLLDILTGVWVLLAAGVWLVAGWDAALWLRTRYRLTRTG